MATGASVAAGTYEVDRARFDAARELFLREQYARRPRRMGARRPRAPRRAHAVLRRIRLLPAGLGPRLQRRALFRQGLETVNRAIALAPDAPLNVEDAELKIHSAAELKAELENGLERTADDFNPLKLFRERK